MQPIIEVQHLFKNFRTSRPWTVYPSRWGRVNFSVFWAPTARANHDYPHALRLLRADPRGHPGLRHGDLPRLAQDQGADRVCQQDNTLDPDLTVEQNLIVFASYFSIPSKEAQSGPANCSSSSLCPTAARQVMDLSGGMIRRLILARSLINRPDLLIRTSHHGTGPAVPPPGVGPAGKTQGQRSQRVAHHPLYGGGQPAL